VAIVGGFPTHREAKHFPIEPARELFCLSHREAKHFPIEPARELFCLSHREAKHYPIGKTFCVEFVFDWFVFVLIRGRKNKEERRSSFPLVHTMALSPIRDKIAFSPYVSTLFGGFHQNKLYIDKYKKGVYSCYCRQQTIYTHFKGG
jgi:hypothetical protein